MNRIENVLEREMRAVVAPEELWERIQSPRKFAPPKSNTGRNACATVLLILLVWGIEARRGEFRSTDAGQIRAWVQKNAGLDVPLRERAGASVQLVGARLLKGPVPTAEIEYRAGNQPATLVVSRRSADTARQLTNGGRTFSWSARGQVYTLACATPEALRAACALCHSDPERL